MYRRLLEYVLDEGERTAPRGEATLEVRPLVFTLLKPYNRLVTFKGRGLNSAFALVEAFQLIAGITDGEQQVRFNSNISNWLGEDGQIEAPYGVAIRDQLPEVIRLLQRDPDSRQAVVTVYDGKEHFRPMKNVPCTCDLQFFVRKGELEMIAHMRSNDLWWGMPYDVFQFTALQEAVAAAVGRPVGKYTHLAGSGHLYEPFFAKARALVDGGHGAVCGEEQRALFPGWTYDEIQERVRSVLKLEDLVARETVTHELAVSMVAGPARRHLNLLLGYQAAKKRQ